MTPFTVVCDDLLGRRESKVVVRVLPLFVVLGLIKRPMYKLPQP